MTKKVYKFIGNKLKNEFLNLYALTGSLSQAADKAGISRQAHYKWLKTDKDGKYHEAFAAANNMLTDVLEEAALERATKGVPVKIYYKGKVVGERYCPSDKLLMFLLQARRPEMYKQTTTEINNSVNVDMSDVVTEARKRIEGGSDG